MSKYEPSFWEKQFYFDNVDLCIVGGGFTGMSAAVQFLRARPGAKVLVIEANRYGTMASTKNAGFLCFGSPTEVLSYIKRYSEDQWQSLAEMSLRGAERFLQHLGKRSTKFRKVKALEFFSEHDQSYFQEAFAGLEKLNALAKEAGLSELQFRPVPAYSYDNLFTDSSKSKLIQIEHEAQIDPMSALAAYRRLASNLGSFVLLKDHFKSYEVLSDYKIQCKLASGISFPARRLLIANNAFSTEINTEFVKPARGMVMASQPIPGLSLNTNIHAKEGFIYLRNHGSRLIIGGARQLAIQEEATLSPGFNIEIETYLLSYIKRHFSFGDRFNADFKWNGYMGFTASGLAVSKSINNGVYLAAGMNGMGVALSHEVGYDMANRIIKDW